MAAPEPNHIPKPWWERPRFCSELTPPGCSYSFITQLECQIEKGDDGLPVKRCIQLRKRILHCPNKEPVLEEHKQVTEVKASDIQNLHEDVNPCSNGDYKEALRNPEASDVGQALEHVIRLAEDIQEDLAGTAGVRLNAPSSDVPSQDLTPGSPTPSFARERDGFLSRLLRSWTMDRYSEKVGGASEVGKEAPWKDYTREFQEV